VYDHSYNASPYSLKKQLIHFDKLKVTKKLCILGSIKELGNQTEKYHRALLEDIKNLKLKRIILIGEEFFNLRSSYKTYKFYKSYKNYINVMKKDLEYGKNIFVMGSRLNNLDKVIQHIC
jgi:UDP-N-acetylmuramoyl-tripeptide--D-alanyl-D-alanine ligase